MGLLFECACCDLAALLGALSLLYYYATSTFGFWKDRGVPFTPPLPLLGNSLDNVLGRVPVSEQQAAAYRSFEESPYVGIFIFRQPVLMLRDPALVEAVMIKDFTSFYNRGTHYDEDLDPLGCNLVNLCDAQWRNLRNKLSPVFTSGKLKTMHELLVGCGGALLDFLGTPRRTGEAVEARELMAKFATDVIGTCAFGLDMNAISDPDSEFRKFGKTVFMSSFHARTRQVIALTYPGLLKLLRWKFVSNDSQEFFVNALKETIRQREVTGVERNDFLQLMIDLRKQEKTTDGANVLLTDNIMLANAFVFFAAGFETTASTLSYCLFELAHNQDVQDRLHGELKAALDKHGGHPDYWALKEIQYLEQVIKETLRKYPPITTTMRVCTKEYRLPGTDLLLERGQRVVIPIYSIQHDPRYFPHPEKFDPDRFDEDNKDNLTKCTFLAFGDGPRICIGERFAKTEIKVALAMLVMKYRVVPNEKTKYPAKFDRRARFLVPENGLWLNIVERE